MGASQKNLGCGRSGVKWPTVRSSVLANCARPSFVALGSCVRGVNRGKKVGTIWGIDEISRKSCTDGVSTRGVYFERKDVLYTL